MARKKSRAPNGAVTREEIESLSPLARQIAEGLGNAIAHVRGSKVDVRETSLELPDPAPEYTDADIRRVRTRLHMTQKSFAHVMNISPKTVEAWEAGTKSPGPPARRLLQILSDKKAMHAFSGLAKSTEKPPPDRRAKGRARPGRAKAQ